MLTQYWNQYVPMLLCWKFKPPAATAVIASQTDGKQCADKSHCGPQSSPSQDHNRHGCCATSLQYIEGPIVIATFCPNTTSKAQPSVAHHSSKHKR
eukprot:COSAG02_NODE_8341_length_2607_cov_1.547448_4_plen_96_part_00